MIEFKKLRDTSTIPTYGTSGSACFDFYADLKTDVKVYEGEFDQDNIEFTEVKRTYSNEDELVLEPGERALIPTGLTTEMAENFHMKIFSRSGLTSKNALIVLNAPAIIDADYKGETFIILYNASSITQYVRHGDRIAQGEPDITLRIPSLEVISETRDGGLGSTGV